MSGLGPGKPPTDIDMFKKEAQDWINLWTLKPAAAEMWPQAEGKVFQTERKYIRFPYLDYV